MTRASLVTASGESFDEGCAVIEHQEAIDQTHHRVHRVLDNDDRDAFPGERSQHGNDLGGFAGSESRQGFVEKKNVRTSRQRAGEFHQSKLLGRQLAGNAIGDIEKTDAGDGVGGKPAGVVVVLGVDIGADNDIVGDRQSRKWPHDLESAADARVAQPMRLVRRRHLCRREEFRRNRASGIR